MALFQKKPQTSTSAPFYTLGLGKTVLLVGLGNPGKKYEGTRHNIGFSCLNAFAEAHDYDKWIEKKDLISQINIKALGNTQVILCKPQTFMNLSGEAVQKTARFYKVDINHTLVVHDELDIAFGQIRMRVGGSDAGNNGIKSIIQHIGSDFGRIRIGIGSGSKSDAKGHVLTTFSKTEQAQIKPLLRETTSILTEYIYRGELQPETRSFLI